MQHQLGLRRCCALPASCRQEKYDHATLNKTRKRSTACCCSSISPQAFVKATFFVIFIQDVYVLSNPIIIHNNTSLLHIFCSWHCHKCIGMIPFIIDKVYLQNRYSISRLLRTKVDNILQDLQLRYTPKLPYPG